MRKLILIVCMILTAAFLVSCSSSPTESSTETGSAQETEAQVQETEAQTTEETEEVYKPSRKIRISCVGDSITYGVGAGNAAISAYPSQLRRMLGSDYIVSNYGRSSSYMINPKDYPDFKLAAERSVAYTSTNEYQYSITSNPDLVFICLGANDAYVSNTNAGVDQAGYFYKSAVALAKKYQSLDSKPTVVFMYPPARYDAQYRLDYIKSTIIPMIDKAAAECGCEVIDLFSLTEEYAKKKDTKYITTDGIHLADEGYKLMAEAVLKVAKEYRLPE
jgi:lysophospholipase L1-like esterase